MAFKGSRFWVLDSTFANVCVDIKKALCSSQGHAGISVETTRSPHYSQISAWLHGIDECIPMRGRKGVQCGSIPTLSCVCYQRYYSLITISCSFATSRDKGGRKGLLSWRLPL
ncbi:hypothetical protein TNCV_1380261 [Trichonephila clavipes]|nr:hypothetical protein TNCV_1380261 [Trichonephila clavipes]